MSHNFKILFPGNYVLTYLYNQPKLAQFVVQGLVTLFARISNLGWFDSKDDEFVFRNVISDVTKFLQGSADHCMIGVQLLSQLTCEMNQVRIYRRRAKTARTTIEPAPRTRKIC